MKVIARIHTGFADKFGVPRQSGCACLTGQIVFEPPYGNPDAVRGIDGYSHLWLLWGFDKTPEEKDFAPTVRPPRLGGNVRMGVFATRSPFRPNRIGLSVVRLQKVEIADNAAVLTVSGVDMVDGTPIYDIKPYLPYVDAIPDAKGGWSADKADDKLSVVWQDGINAAPDLRGAVEAIVSQDPRPHYIEDGDRVYGMVYAGYEIRWTVTDGVACIQEVCKTTGCNSKE